MVFDFRALHGFLTRQQTEEYLNKSPNGTFLIRFSDSEPGGVTIAWITGKKHVQYYHLHLWVLFRSFTRQYQNKIHLKNSPNVTHILYFFL